MPAPVYYSHNDYVSDGATINYGITFSYVKQLDVVVTVNGVSVPFSWLTASTIQLAAVAANGTAIRIQRTTDISAPVVVFADGSTLASKDLDNAENQLLYAIQELKEQVAILQLALNTAIIPAGNLPVVTVTNNGQILQVVAGVWTLVNTNTTTMVQDEQVDGTNMLIQKKTAPLITIGSAPTISGWTTIHTGTAC